MNEEKNNELLVDTGLSILGGTAGVGIGFAIAGPVGALAGAAVGPVVENIAKWCVSEYKDNVWSKRQAKNIENLLEKSIESISPEDNPNGIPVEEDWIARFFDCAKDTSAEDIQLIWSKILAGEVAAPGRFSYRLLNTLRDISRTEAEFIQHILPFIVHFRDYQDFIVVDKNIVEKYGIRISELLRLDSCGLVQVIPFTSLDVGVMPNDSDRSIYTENYLISLTNDTTEPILNVSFNEVYVLTETGKELCDILYKECNDNYFLDWVDVIHSKATSHGLTLSLHKNIEGRHYSATPEKIYAPSDNK